MWYVSSNITATRAVKMQLFVSCYSCRSKTFLWNPKNRFTVSRKTIISNRGLPVSDLTQRKCRVWTIPKLIQKLIKVPKTFYFFILSHKHELDDCPDLASASQELHANIYGQGYQRNMVMGRQSTLSTTQKTSAYFSV